MTTLRISTKEAKETYSTEIPQDVELAYEREPSKEAITSALKAYAEVISTQHKAIQGGTFDPKSPAYAAWKEALEKITSISEKMGIKVSTKKSNV